jgi:hypothetical protein
MSEESTAEVREYIEELRKRAKKSQTDAKRNLNPLFSRDDRGRPPRDFIESSFMFMRSCDADVGSRPMPCSVFWLSPDLRVAPLANLGMPTRELTAGVTYRFTAVVRNRGDLPVPSAKVEFYLSDPSLGWDTRVSTKLGVAAGRVQAYGASEVSLDYTIAPTLSGHRCLFARVFSFSPRDLPIDDFALNPLIDRHVAQLNLNIVPQASAFTINWIHHRNAAELLQIVPMTARVTRPLRVESVTALTLVGAAQWRDVQGQLNIELEPAEGPAIEARRTDLGLELHSQDREAMSLERQADLTKRVQAALRAMETGRADAAKFEALFKEFRAMTAQTVRSRLTLGLPDAGLKRGQAIGLNVIKRDIGTGEATGGIGLFVAGEPRER